MSTTPSTPTPIKVKVKALRADGRPVTKTYEDIRVGMAQFVHDAIYANSARRDA